MITITERCLQSLTQEPGGPECVQYLYRVLDSSLAALLRMKGGCTIVELISDHKVQSRQLSEILGIAPNTIKIDKVDIKETTKNNPVAG